MVDLYADMFELAPVSLWLEDYSGLKVLFDRWRAEGVVDLRAHLCAHPERIAECTRNLKVLRVNQRTLALYGARDLQHLSDNLHRVLRDDMLSAYVEELGQLWDGRLRLSTQTVNYTLSGERLVMLFNASILPGHEERWDRVLVALEDVSDRVRAEQHARSLFEHSPVSLWAMDFSGVFQLIEDARLAHGAGADPRTVMAMQPGFAVRCMKAVRVVDVNRRTLAMFGAEDKASLLARLGSVFRDEMRSVFGELLVDLWQGRLRHQREALVHALDDRAMHVYLQFSVLPGHEQRWDETLVSLIDITARKRAEADLAYFSTHDSLTGLCNRAFFSGEIQRLEQQCVWPVTVLVMDLDGLKSANDSHGHAAGDELLRRAGGVIGAFVQGPVTAARTGGDEFALLMPGSSEHEGMVLARGLRDALAEHNLEHTRRPLSFSIGVAASREGERLETVIHRADARMYADKREMYATRGIDRRASE